MRSSHSNFASRIVLLVLLSGGIATPALAAAVGPGGGGGGAPGGGNHSFASGRSGGCTTFSFGKPVATLFSAQNGMAPNGQPCSGSEN
jgi:hypothetical protein